MSTGTPRKAAETDVAKGRPGKEICKVRGCDRIRVAWGNCGLHHSRLKRMGRVEPTHRSQSRAETIGKDGRRKCWKCGKRKKFNDKNFPKDPRKKGDALKGTCRCCLNRAVKNSTLLSKYGITLGEYESIRAKQGNGCAICGQVFKERGGSKSVRSAHVDHCHVTGSVRGLLCHHCNVLLGHSQENPEILTKALAYLKRSKRK